MENNKNIWQKLMELQKGVTSFKNTEESDKKRAGSKNSEYKYTPGWQILQEIRAQMDVLGLMMPVSIVGEQHEMVEYPVYKIIDGKVTSFIKKENLSVVTMEYTWVDTQTGETAGPFRMTASGANGIDKSTASAISAAERYIFLKFFHIPTKDNDELDAHDSSNIPGLKEQPQNATDNQIANHKTTMTPAPKTVAQPVPAYGQDYERAVCQIAMFAKGTPSHIDAVNMALAELTTAGYPTGDSVFVDTMVRTADEKRMRTYKRA